MMNDNMKQLLKCLIRGIIIATICIIIGLLITNFSKFLLYNVLFIEGMILIVIGGISIVGGISAGNSLKTLGRDNTQYNTTLNYEIVKKENEIKKSGLSSNKGIPYDMISAVIAGLVCIVVVIVILSF